MQETHLRKKDYKYLISKQLGEEFYSLATQRKRGAVIFDEKELEPKEIFKDNNGKHINIKIMHR